MNVPETRDTPATTSDLADRSDPADRADRADLVDAVASAVRAVPGVADLHAGVFGEVGTYLPGRRVAGITIGPGGAEIHVALLIGHPVRQTAALVRAAVAPLTGGPVHVTVEDVVADPGPDPDPASGPAATPTGPAGPVDGPGTTGGGA